MDLSAERLDSVVSKKEIEAYIRNAGSADITYFGGKYMGGITIMQHPDEIAGVIYDILESGKKIHNYLEVGAAAGGTTFIINKYLQPDNIVLIDDNSNERCVFRADILKDVTYTEIIGHSHTEGTVDVLRSLNMTFDAVFVDANHTYEAVRGDIDIYGNFLNFHGLMIMHDTALSYLGAMKVVQEMKE